MQANASLTMGAGLFHYHWDPLPAVASGVEHIGDTTGNEISSHRFSINTRGFPSPFLRHPGFGDVYPIAGTARI